MDKIEIIGNLGNDPEMSYTPSGASVTKFSVAVNRRWTQDGERKEETIWYRVNAWGKQAEACNEYLSKGSQVFVEGRLDARMFEGNDGYARISLDVTARDVQFLGSPGGREGGSGQQGGGMKMQGSQNQGNQPRQQQPRQQQAPAQEGWDDIDDLPF